MHKTLKIPNYKFSAFSCMSGTFFYYICLQCLLINNKNTCKLSKQKIERQHVTFTEQEASVYNSSHTMLCKFSSALLRCFWRSCFFQEICNNGDNRQWHGDVVLGRFALRTPCFSQFLWRGCRSAGVGRDHRSKQQTRTAQYTALQWSLRKGRWQDRWKSKGLFAQWMDTNKHNFLKSDSLLCVQLISVCVKGEWTNAVTSTKVINPFATRIVMPQTFHDWKLHHIEMLQLCSATCAAVLNGFMLYIANENFTFIFTETRNTKLVWIYFRFRFQLLRRRRTVPEEKRADVGCDWGAFKTYIFCAHYYIFFFVRWLIYGASSFIEVWIVDFSNHCTLHWTLCCTLKHFH